MSYPNILNVVLSNISSDIWSLQSSTQPRKDVLGTWLVVLTRKCYTIDLKYKNWFVG